MNVFGYDSNNVFDQSLNTDDSVNFNKVTVVSAIVDNQQLATKLYVDNNIGGGGITYSGVNPATNKIYKANGATGLDAVDSTLSDDGVFVRTNIPLKCLSITKITDSSNFEIGDSQLSVDIMATNGLTSNKVVVNGGTNQQYMMADGSVLEASAQNGNANFYLYNNINGLSVPPPANGDVSYNATTLASTTIVYISHLTRDSIDIDVYLALINTLDDLYIQDQTNSANFAKFNITSAPTLTPNSYISIPVAQVQFGGNGNTSFGANHDILVSFFSNLQEINTRLTNLETATQNQTSVPLTTTFNQQINTPILRVQAISSLTPTFYDFVGIGLGNSVVQINSLNGITSKKFALETGLSSEFLKGDGSVDTNTYLPLAGGTVTGTIDMGSNKVTTTYVPVSSADLCNKTYVDSLVGVSIQGMPYNSLYGNTTTAPTGTRSLWYTGITPYATTINGIQMYVDSGGSDTCHFGIYRGYLRAGVGTNPGLNMTLVGQSATSVVLTTGLPYNRVPITLIGGQSLAFTAGSYLTIAFHTSGINNTFLSSPTGFSSAGLCYTTISNYATTTFPATITNSSISAVSTQRICFDLY